MSAILEHARSHYFKGATAAALFGDLSAIGGVPTYDAYGIQVPEPNTLLLPFTLSREQEESLRRSLPAIKAGLRIEEESQVKPHTMTLTSSGLLKKRHHITLTQEGERSKMTLLSEKEEPLLDTLLRETVLGEALIEYWVNSGFFKRRSLEEFDKQFVVEAALEEQEDGRNARRQLTAEDAMKELEKARKLLLELTPKSLPSQSAHSP